MAMSAIVFVKFDSEYLWPKSVVCS